MLNNTIGPNATFPHGDAKMVHNPPGVTEAVGYSKQCLRVHFDESCGTALRRALIEAPALFVERDPSCCDIVVFGSDEISYLNRSELLRSHRSKAICITESDIPTFRLPGLYAANIDSFITSSRTRTMNYFISERERGNPEVRRLIGHNSEKRYLYSFMGGSNSWTRKRLFRALTSQADTLIEPTDSYNHWLASSGDVETRAAQMYRYANVLASSKFSLCPRGCGLSSYRLFESMSLGVAPVIISERWRPIEGIDWSFAIFIRDNQISQIDHIVRSHESEWEQRGRAGLAIYTHLLAQDTVATLLHAKIVEVMDARNSLREMVVSPMTRSRAATREVYWKVYGWCKYLLLWGFYLSGQPIPVRLNRPTETQLNIPPSAGFPITKV